MSAQGVEDDGEVGVWEGAPVGRTHAELKGDRRRAIRRIRILLTSENLLFRSGRSMVT